MLHDTQYKYPKEVYIKLLSNHDPQKEDSATIDYHFNSCEYIEYM